MTREEIAAAEERMTRNLMPTRRQVELLCAQARAYLDLVERIEAKAIDQREKYDRWKAEGSASEATLHAAWHTELHLRAILDPKEPTE